MSIKPCILIPIFNNKDTIYAVVESLEYLNLPCLIVDDGSDDATRHVLRGINDAFPWVSIIERERNGGKGAAMETGFHAAFDQGYSHAVQIDADGQHDALDVPRFLEQAQRAPTALILGDPIFDDSAPAARRYGRYITTFWVRIETWSTDIRDALYGFRCYPLQAIMELYAKSKIGAGMVFDIEIAVRLHWQGVPMINVKTKVTYLRDGISHFNYIDDNLRITILHTRLFFGMLRRFPQLLFGSRL